MCVRVDLCRHDLRKDYLFLLISASVSGDCFFSSVYRWWWCVVFYCFAACFVNMAVCIVVRLVFMSGSVMVSVLRLMVVYLVLLKLICFLSLGVSLCSGCDQCAFYRWFS